MRRASIAGVCPLLISGLFSSLACGSRTELVPGRLVASAGAGGSEMQPPIPRCVTERDCPQPAPGQCGTASCNEGSCALDIVQLCDDGDPCTVDACVNNACSFVDGRVDADGDGVFARGSASDPKAALGCGNDCDDAAPEIFPGAAELCDSFDNDCNGIIDEGTTLEPSGSAPIRVSPSDAESSGADGLAFDGVSFGATMTSKLGSWQGQFRQLDANGKPLADAQRVAHVNAESYGGPLVWSGQRYLTAYYDARQDSNYEIYVDVLNRQGERLTEDLRVTNADDFSLDPSVVWTGAEALVVWEDRRFENDGDSSALFGQRVSIDGELIGGNLRLSPAGLYGQRASIALSEFGLGIAFLSLEPGDTTRLRFMTTSRSLDKPSDATAIDFVDPDGVSVTALGDKYVLTFNQHGGSVIGPSIFGAVLGKSGALEYGPQSMTAGAKHARSHATYSYGDRFVMVWADDTDGPYQLYAQTFDKKLAPISPRLRVTNGNADALFPRVAASADGGLGILFTDESTGSRQTYFTRLNCRGASLK
jgi:hypothetical protein